MTHGRASIARSPIAACTIAPAASSRTRARPSRRPSPAATPSSATCSCPATACPFIFHDDDVRAADRPPAAARTRCRSPRSRRWPCAAAPPATRRSASPSSSRRSPAGRCCRSNSSSSPTHSARTVLARDGRRRRCAAIAGRYTLESFDPRLRRRAARRRRDGAARHHHLRLRRAELGQRHLRLAQVRAAASAALAVDAVRLHLLPQSEPRICRRCGSCTRAACR